MSGVGQVVGAMRHMRRVAQVAIAKAASMRSQVEHRMQSLVVQVEMSRSCTIGEASQLLEWALEAVASSMVMTNALNTQAAIEGLGQELQAKFEHDHVELQQKIGRDAGKDR